MANIVQKSAFSPLPLDTLGQLRKIGGETPPQEIPESGLKILKKRARSKWYTSAIVGRLLFLDSEIHKYYQRAFYCSHVLKQEGKKITTKYCDTRICHVCNRIRTAKLMNGYVDQLMALENTEFVTLTIPNCTAENLSETVDKLLKAWRKIVDAIRKRGIVISGIRKLEITYNNNADTYHPHLHILVDGGYGSMIIDEHLKRFPEASIKAQDSRKADSGSLVEMFKYTTKIVSTKKGAINVYLPALDKIMIALKGRRCFQPFGKIKKVDEDLTDLEAIEYDGIQEYDFVEWIWDECDWVYGKQTLTGYVSPDVNFNFVE